MTAALIHGTTPMEDDARRRTRISTLPCGKDGVQSKLRIRQETVAWFVQAISISRIRASP